MMPIDYRKYPANWLSEIRPRILARANNCCEQCGIANYAINPRGNKVILTIHHVGTPKLDGSAGDATDKHDCRDENLVALCQRCHLMADQKLRKLARQVTP